MTSDFIIGLLLGLLLALTLYVAHILYRRFHPRVPHARAAAAASGAAGTKEVGAATDRLWTEDAMTGSDEQKPVPAVPPAEPPEPFQPEPPLPAGQARSSLPSPKPVGEVPAEKPAPWAEAPSTRPEAPKTVDELDIEEIDKILDKL